MKNLFKNFFQKNNNLPNSEYFSINELDKKIEKYLDINDGFFIELGANDGVSQSNTLYFERYRNWKGILIEPTPHNYLMCRKNRSSRSNVYCCACTSFDYKEKFVEIIYSNLMSIPLGLESDIEDATGHANIGKQFLNPTDNNFVFGAISKPLNDLIIASNAPNVMDLLSLDVEGAEIEVLKGIDHDKFRFKYICIESRSKDKLVDYLKRVGYDFVEDLSIHDYLFVNTKK